MATRAKFAQVPPDIQMFIAQTVVASVETSMADRSTFAQLDAWIDAVFSYGESRRIPVVVVRSGANLVAIANLGPDFDVTLPYSRPLVEGRGRTAWRESAVAYGERIARTFERAVIEARKSRMADFIGRPPAAGRA